MNKECLETALTVAFAIASGNRSSISGCQYAALGVSSWASTDKIRERASCIILQAFADQEERLRRLESRLGLNDEKSAGAADAQHLVSAV
ncbi:hypothetical protein CCAX7_30430 [Capsulimonas corticalis]|uniref:Uncharacterized protein n=1 Tax=Capsulimonas corticalis TaxID=2219043 RepID=A0A402CSR5_9BACT|nr:hypothetical protein [Capsulimonas corticalis]BDI30992.1 hypothetical protein CCAX7_30430 [Capsulimonas corticalis]